MAQLGGDRDLARVRPGELVGGRERRRPSPSSASHALRRGHGRGPRQAIRVGEREARPSALISCVPLRSARPSFASSVSGSIPVSRSARRPGITWPPSSTSPRPISGSARCASGARSPGRPDAPLRRDDRVDPRLQERQEPVDHAPAGSRSGRARACSPAAAASPEPRPGQRRADAHRVAHEEVLLELARVGRRDVGRGQVTEARRDPVDDLARRDQALDDGAGLVHAGPGVDVQARHGAAPRHRLHVSDREVGAGEDDDLSAGGVPGAVRARSGGRGLAWIGPGVAQAASSPRA